MKKVLIVVAHPDDEILSMGGTIKKLIKCGDRLRLLILATGLTARDGNTVTLEEHRKNAILANKHLGIEDVIFGEFIDNQLDTYPLIEITKYIERQIIDFKPDVIFTHFEHDLNIDHSVTVRAVLTATRPNTPTFVSQVYAFEVLSSTDWYFGNMHRKFCPNVYVDITHEIESKIEAMRFYKSEISSFPHQRSEEGIRVLAMKSGSEIGTYYAERFQLLRGLYDKL